MNRRFRFAMCTLIVIASSAPVFGETTEILATGPDQRVGIPYLSANVIPYFQVSYQTAAQSAESDSGSAFSAASGIRILYTERTIVPYSEWKPAACGGLSALTVQDDPLVYFLSGNAGWSLFIVFPPKYPGPCSFASAFFTRFLYFLGITHDAAVSSFPAVLQIP